MIGLMLNLTPRAIGIALSPLAIVAVVVLRAQGNRRGALGFLFGWGVKGVAAEPMLERWRTWMMVHQNTIMNGFICNVGLVLIAQGVSR